MTVSGASSPIFLRMVFIARGEQARGRRSPRRHPSRFYDAAAFHSTSAGFSFPVDVPGRSRAPALREPPRCRRRPASRVLKKAAVPARVTGDVSRRPVPLRSAGTVTRRVQLSPRISGTWPASSLSPKAALRRDVERLATRDSLRKRPRGSSRRTMSNLSARRICARRDRPRRPVLVEASPIASVAFARRLPLLLS